MTFPGSFNFWWKLLVIGLMIIVEANKNLYAMFDMTKGTFDKEQLKKKFKKILIKYHPDKNKAPDANEKFLEYKEAFEILDDDQKRTIYDHQGYEAAKSAGSGSPPPGGAGGFGGFDAGDLFERFFGGGSRGGFHHQQQRRTGDAKVELHISLEDAYTGKTHRVQIPRTIICKRCKGVGAANPKDVSVCSACGGTGTRTFYRQFGPGMVQQVRTTCESCQGKGKTFKSKCPHCHGNKVERITQEVDIKIDPGILDGTNVKFPKMADELPEHETGDLYVVLKIDPHPRFRRDGANLYTRMNISLKEAMLGVDRIIKHLDGRMVPIHIEGTTIQPGHVETIANGGMPVTGGSRNQRGNLFVEFSVHLPISPTKDLLSALQKLPKQRDEL